MKDENKEEVNETQNTPIQDVNEAFNTTAIDEEEKELSDEDKDSLKKMLEIFQRTSASLPKKTYGRAYKKKRRKKMKEQKKSRKLNRTK